MPAETQLVLRARSDDQTRPLRDAVLAGPGGRILVDHIDDGPWHLTTLVGDFTAPHWQISSWLAAFPRYDFGKLLYSFPTATFLLPQLGYEYALWWQDEVSFHVEAASEQDYPEVPTRADLSDHIAGVTESPQLGRVLTAHVDQIDTTIPPLIASLAGPGTTSITELAERLAAALGDPAT